MQVRTNGEMQCYAKKKCINCINNRGSNLTGHVGSGSGSQQQVVVRRNRERRGLTTQMYTGLAEDWHIIV